MEPQRRIINVQVRLSCWNESHELTAPAGHQGVVLPVLRDDSPTQRGFVELAGLPRVSGFCQDDLVSSTEVEPERLRALHQSGDVGVTSDEVVDELLSGCLLLADHSAPGVLIALDERRYDRSNGTKKRLRRG